MFSLPFFNACQRLNFNKWIVFYGQEADWKDFGKAHLVVLDPESKVDLQQLKQHNRLVLGYLSLGEIHRSRDFFKRFEWAGVLLEANPNWPDARLVDVRAESWQKFVLEQRIPQLMAQGFNGIFIDTLDSVIHYQSTHLDMVGLEGAAVDLLEQIDQRFPDLFVMVNRGVELAPAFAPYVDAVLAESFVTDWNFKTRSPRMRKANEAEGYLKVLKRVHEEHDVKLYSLDYWDMQDRKTVKQIYALQKSRGYIPYVSTIELNQIY